MTERKRFQMSHAAMGEQDRDYAEALTDCETLEELRVLVAAYRELAIDAEPVVTAMTADDFKEFRRGLALERRGKFAGDAWAQQFGAVLMPFPMLRVAELAQQFKAPFGVTWQRCRDLRPDLLTLPAPPKAGA